MRVWAVANQKGGVGKTTTTISAGGILAQAGKRVLLIDLDPHGSLTSYLGIDPETVERSVYDLFQQVAAGKQTDADSAIQATLFENLFLLPASTAIATLERQLGTRNGMGLVLKQVLDKLADKFDNVIIDCPPMLGLLMINALAACKRVIIPVQTEHLAIKGMERMLRTMEMIQRSLNADIAYTILPTMYDKRTVASRQSLQRLQNQHQAKMTQIVIPVDTRLRDASHEGKPISCMAGDSQGQQAYMRFVDTLTGSRKSTNKAVA
jgi:chromosome partitioning protein